MATNLKFDYVICIGNGGEQANQLSQTIAGNYQLSYLGFLNKNTELKLGCYHTSIYDIKLQELVDKLENINNLKIVVLDQNESCYNNAKEFHDTIDLGQAFVDRATVEFINPSMANPFRQLLQHNKSFCIFPFTTVRQFDNGIRHCCYMEETNCDDFYNDPRTIKLRNQMIAGERTSLCKKCYAVEDTGAISERQNQTINMAYQLGHKSIQDVVNNTKIIRYEIQLDNKCNLMCRMCAPNLSNLIAEEYKKINWFNGDTKVSRSNAFDIIDFDTVQQVKVEGGEPSVSKQFYQFLEKCIALGRTDLEIFISTNAVALSKEFIKLVAQFPNFHAVISVDGFDQVNQYIRWPSDWEKFKSNVEVLKKILNPHNHFFNTAVSIYNISELYSLFKFLEENNNTSLLSIGYVWNPEHLQPWNFPDKQIALEDLNKIKTLKTYQTDLLFRSKIDGLINQMQICTPNLETLKKFFAFNDTLDQSRNVKLIDYIPKLEQCRRWVD